MSKRAKKPQGDQYKRGYANGVRAAVERPVLATQVAKPRLASVCKGCLLHGAELHQLATRLEFAMGVKCEERS